MGGEFFTDFKSSNGIEISWKVEVLSNFKWFRGSTPGGLADGWMGVGVGMGVWGDVPCMHACTRMHTHMHTCTFMLNMLNMDASMSAAICNFYTCINVHVCMCVCPCACVWGHPPCPQMPPTHLPPPQSHRWPKTPKFNKSWTNWDNSILFEDSLPLNIPELI